MQLLNFYLFVNLRRNKDHREELENITMLID